MQTTIAGHEHVCGRVGCAIFRPYAQRQPLRVRGSALTVSKIQLIFLPSPTPSSIHSLLHSSRSRWGCCQLQRTQALGTGRIYRLTQHRSAPVGAVPFSAERASTDDRQVGRRRRRVSPGLPLEGQESLQGSWRVFEVSVPLEQDPGKDDYAVSDALCRAVSARLACQVLCTGHASMWRVSYSTPPCNKCPVRCSGCFVRVPITC